MSPITNIILFLVISIAIYSLLAIGLNIQWGETGIINFGYGAFFGIGAYTSAILTTTPPSSQIYNRTVGFDFPMVIGLIAAFFLAAVVGVIIAAIAIDVGGSYLALFTLGFQAMVLTIARNEGWLTNGSRGMPNVEPLYSLDVPVSYDAAYVIVAMGLLIVSYVSFKHLSKSGFGRVLNAIREDKNVPQALGKNTSLFKIKAFGLGCGLAGFAGGLWAHYLQFVSPTVFPLTLTFLIWIGVIIGGPGDYRAVIAGTGFILFINQVVRFIPGTVPFSSELPYLRVIVIGILMILVLYYRPYGMLGNEERYLAGQDIG